MRRAWTWWLAWGLLALFAALTVATVVLDELTAPLAEVEESFWSDLALVLVFAAFAVVGALVASRQPRNAVGWLFLAAPLFALAGAFAEEYAYRAYVIEEDGLPLAGTLAWLYSWAWFPALGAIGLIPLLFPDGRLPGPRWRFVLWTYVGLIVATCVGAAISPGPIDQNWPGSPDKPLTIEGSDRVLDVAAALGGILATFVLLAVLASVVVRFRRSRGDERQQLKWMLVAIAALAGQIAVTELLPVTIPDALQNTLFALSVAFIPIAAGIAILKYRLYDIDLVIRKTLVYGSLTVLLGLAYVGLVLATQAVFSSLAGSSDLAIAASTLVVAALFLPLRGRVQRLVDRRFYRSRYDARRTVEGFAGRLREQVELDALRTDLEGVVSETMRPERVSLWLREESK